MLRVRKKLLRLREGTRLLSMGVVNLNTRLSSSGHSVVGNSVVGNIKTNTRRLFSTSEPSSSSTATTPSAAAAAAASMEVPVIDVSPLVCDDDSKLALDPNDPKIETLVNEVRSACGQWGFFQIVNHSVDKQTIDDFREQTANFFRLPDPVKFGIRRSADNSRGFFDDELTKRKKDWKQGFDFGMTPLAREKDAWGFTVGDIPDDDNRHNNLDGFNRFPDEAVLPLFRSSAWKYFERVTSLSENLSKIMAMGMGVRPDYFSDELKHTHSSFLRLNYYPVLDKKNEAAAESKPLGISPHTDAGFLTILLQDDGCHSLQVRNRFNNSWHTVHPIPGALTINTGDMAQVWSNDLYYAPEHRVVANRSKERYSMPFFYNPGYHTQVAPVPSCISEDQPLAYTPISWGYFRWQRYCGDFADFGKEVQISDFHTSKASRSQDRVDHQEEFMSKFDGGRQALAASEK